MFNDADESTAYENGMAIPLKEFSLQKNVYCWNCLTAQVDLLLFCSIDDKNSIFFSIKMFFFVYMIQCASSFSFFQLISFSDFMLNSYIIRHFLSIRVHSSTGTEMFV